MQRNVSIIGTSLRVVNPSPCVSRLLHAAGVDETLGRHADGR
jgi:hypothetical protein